MFGNSANPITEPATFKELFMEAGAAKIFPTILDAMKSDYHSDKRCMLNERSTVSIIYTLMYGQSQQCNWFQVANAKTLKGLGTSSRGVETLRNMGLTSYPNTVHSDTKQASSEHIATVHQIFQDAVTKKYMTALFIDDFHIIHTHHCPSSSSQTQVSHMTPLLVKQFPTMPAIKPHSFADQDSLPANLALLEPLL